MRVSRLFLPVIFLLLQSFAVVFADETSLLFGSGPQAGSDQRNQIVGLEYSFYTFERTPQQHLQIGVSIARMQTNLESSRELTAISVYPQLTFYPRESSRIARSMPDRMSPFFFTRMLGPAYISESTLGQRKQANHFAFHAEIGAGFAIRMQGGRSALIRISWRHISNANLSSPNDGIDVPFTISLGVRY